MPGRGSSNGDVRFGVFELDVQACELLKKGSKVKLQQQPFELLLILLERPGTVVSREELRKRLWPADVYVDFDRSLNKAIVKLRDALGDSSGCPLYIETLPRIGYRFIGPVNGKQLSPEPPVAENPQLVDGLTGTRIASTKAEGAAGRAQISTSKISSVWRQPARVFFTIGTATVLIAGIATSWLVRRARPAVEPIQSLAVLPLKNLSGAADQEYFSDGLTEALTTDLAKFSALRVLSRTSLMQYKGSKKTVPEIARELEVDAVIEGTVLRSGDHLRITVNLIRARPEMHLWAEVYEAEAGDVFRVQREVAQSVARVLRPKVASPEQVLLENRRSVNPEAQDLYFRGLYAMNSGTAEAAQTAINYFREVVGKDANFADAHASLAFAYSQWLPGETSPREKMPKAREEALKALEIDETLSEGHTALGFIELCYDWNWAAAEKEFKRAIELKPNSVFAHEFYARELVILGRTDEGLAQLKQARDLQVNLSSDYPAWVSYLSHSYDNALKLAQEIIVVDPNNAWGHYQVALVYEQTGKPTEAIHEYLKFENLARADPQRIARLQAAFAKDGARGYWQRNLEDYRESAGSRYSPAVLAAGMCLRIGEKDRAFELLEKGFRQRDDLMINLNVDPVFDSIRTDPRFQDLVRRVGFPE
jgi:TolB-like protein/DNA-binding winged helix-turn-helix (wHTH) protein